MLEALEAAIWSGPELTREIARLARAFPPVSGAAPSVSDLLLEGFSARFTLGYQASVQPFRAAVTALLADDLDPAAGLRWFALGTAAAGSLWDDKATFDLSDRWVNTARAAGAFTTLPVALAFHAVSDAMAGHFREADTRWATMLEVLTVTHGPASARRQQPQQRRGARLPRQPHRGPRDGPCPGARVGRSRAGRRRRTSAGTSPRWRTCSAETTRRRCPAR